MPKESSERIIDWPYSSPTSRGGSISVGTGGGGGGGATNLDALTDVIITAPANGQVLSYNAGSGQWVNSANAQSVPNPHGLSSSYHNGLLNWPLINFSGSDMADLAVHRHVDLQGIGPNDHHNQVHVLATGTALGPDHSISGANAGEVLRALGPTTAAFDVLQHTDLGSVLPDQHHSRVHDIIGGDPLNVNPVHTVTGADFTVVGVHPANALALLPTSSNPGATQSILRTDATGNLQLDTNLLYVDADNNRIGVNVVPGAGPLGAAAALDIRAATTGDVTQRIRQIAGQTQRLWRVEDTTGNELIVMDEVGNLQSGNPAFVSGLLGWRITPQGNAEFNNIWARGELHATVFVKDEVHATGGTFYVATAGTLHDDAVIDSTLVDDDVLLIKSTVAGDGVPLQIQSTSASFTGTELHVSWIGNVVNINDPPSGPAFYFNPGDIVRVKTEIAKPVPPDTLRLADLWLEINSATQNDGYATYSVFKRSGSDCKIPKGTALVSYGKQGDGRILMTSDLQNAPYIDVFTTGYQVWTGNAGSIIPRVRLGRLDGLPVAGVQGNEQYGLVAGTDLSDPNGAYFIASNQQLALYKVPIRLNDGTNDTGLWTANGNLKIGKNVGAAATTGFQFDPVTGDVVIGNVGAGNFLRWQQLTGILTVSGTLTVTDPGTTVNKTYVDTQDASYDNLAGGTYHTDGVLGGYALVAQNNAQAYGSARRITGVTGIWDSPNASTISWTGPGGLLTVTLQDGRTRNIAAGNTGSMSVRTYLYVDISIASGNLTMIPLTTPDSTHAGYVLIAVATPAPASTGITGTAPKASVTVVAGSTYISGGNIFTGSIRAANIEAGTITANEIFGNTLTLAKMATEVTDAISSSQTNAQSYSDARRVVSVTGTWTVTNGNTIAFSGTPPPANLVVRFGNGGNRPIVAEAAHTLSGAAGTRHFLYIYLNDPDPMPMYDSTGVGGISANHALIAVADVGVDKASINIVAGSTYISGDNILTGSVTANQIKAFSITANEIDASVYVSAGKYRATAISDTFSITNNASAQPRVVSWSSTTVRRADGTNLTISAGSLDTTGQPLGLLFYLYANYTIGTTGTMQTTTDVATMGAGAMLIAIAQAGAIAASYRVVAGDAVITGDNIFANTIVAANIAAGAVTATKINVDGNVMIQNGGSLILGSTGTPGSIHSSGKSYGISGGTGYFLGFSGTTPVFSVGSSSSYIDWNGTTLTVAANSLAVSGSGSNLISLSGSSPPLSATLGLMVNSLTGSGAAVTLSTALEVPTSVKAQRFSATSSIDTPTLTITHLTLNDPNVGAPFVSNMLQFTRNANTHYLGYDNSGDLHWDGDMIVDGSLSSPSVIATGNHIVIQNSFTPPNSSTQSGAQTGEIRWDNSSIYIWVGGSWRRATLNTFP